MTERGGLLPKSQNTALCISGRDILAFGSQSLNMSLCSFVVEYMYIYNLVDIQLSSVPWPTGSSGGHEGRFSRDPRPVCSTWGPCEQFRHGQRWPLFDAVHPAFITADQFLISGFTRTRSTHSVKFQWIPAITNVFKFISFPRTLYPHLENLTNISRSSHYVIIKRELNKFSF